jgi:hypothetical protein
MGCVQVCPGIVKCMILRVSLVLLFVYFLTILFGDAVHAKKHLFGAL